MVPGLFQALDREQRPLSNGLVQLVVRPALEQVSRLTRSDLEGRADDDITESLIGTWWCPASVGPVAVGEGNNGREHARAGDAPGQTLLVESRRFPLQWAIHGSPEWLDWWPDGADDGLLAIDELLGELDPEDDEWRRDWNRRIELCTRRFVRDGSVVRGFVEIPRDHPGTPAETAAAAVEVENELLTRFVEALRRSAQHHYGNIAASIRDGVRERRARLAWQHELAEGLSLYPAPSLLALAEPDVADEGDDTVALPPARLEDPSVVALLSTIRCWADKVAQYPKSFLALGEDDLSNLLAVTLALTFGVAEREVFCRKGKTDIYVPVAAIRRLAGHDAGSSEEIAFVTEAKKGSGPALADEAKAQLDGYVPVRSRHAALLFYVEAQDVGTVSDRILTSLRQRKDYLHDDRIEGSPFPILRFANSSTGQESSVAIAFVHLS